MTVLTVIFFIGSVLASGCVQVLPDPGAPAKRLVLEPTFEALEQGRSKALSIAVARPTASELYESKRLIIKTHQEAVMKVDYIAGVEWQDILPTLVQRDIVRGLEKAHYFKGVGFQEERFKQDILLEVDIRHFEGVVTSQDQYAHVVFGIKAIRNPGRTVILQTTIETKQPLLSRALDRLVEGLTQAYESALIKMVRECGSLDQHHD